VETAHASRMSLSDYQTAWCHIPEGSICLNCVQISN